MIQIGACSLEVSPRNTATGKSILSALTFEAGARSWSDEVYFYASITVALESEGKHVVEKGEIAFWVQGNATAIGFGATRASRGGEIRLVAPTNIGADVVGEGVPLRSVRPGERVCISLVAA